MQGPKTLRRQEEPGPQHQGPFPGLGTLLDDTTREEGEDGVDVCLLCRFAIDFPI